MTRAEQETVIRWDREDRVVHIWSADPTVWRKLDRLGVAVREETRAQRTGEITGRFYVPMPVARFRWGVNRERTAAQVAAAQQAAVRLRNAQKLLAVEPSTIQE
jgi:hypothetical protein